MNVTLDMDGTIADLYGVDGWLDALRREDASPYSDARPMCGNELDNLVRKLRTNGVRVEVVSWLSKGNPSDEFNKAVKSAKVRWLREHVPSIDPRDVHVVRHGTDKWEASRCRGVLFDDEEGNRAAWEGHGGKAVSVTNGTDVVEGLRRILRTCSMSE